MWKIVFNLLKPIMSVAFSISFLAACGGASVSIDTDDGDIFNTSYFHYSPVYGRINAYYEQTPDSYYCCSSRPRYWVNAGALPPGLGLSAGDGKISGYPTSPWNGSFQICLEFKNYSARQCQYVQGQIR